LIDLGDLGTVEAGGDEMARHIDAPEARRQRRIQIGGVIAMLVASAACLAIAPALMPRSYSIVEHSISESAAQRLEGAWLARSGLLLFGFAAMAVASLAGSHWGTLGRVAHRTYGISLIGSAAWGHMPFEDVPYDEFEDFLHSVASTAVGFSFVAGVLLVSLRRQGESILVRAFDWVALAVSLVVPVVMFNVSGVAGLVQRLMFLTAYIWYGLEALRSTETTPGRVGAAKDLASVS
jgi:hypothetical protein